MGLNEGSKEGRKHFTVKGMKKGLILHNLIEAVQELWLIIERKPSPIHVKLGFTLKICFLIFRTKSRLKVLSILRNKFFVMNLNLTFQMPIDVNHNCPRSATS